LVSLLENFFLKLKHVMSIREPETVNPTWTAIFRYDFGVLGIGASLLTFVLIVIWLFMSPLNGLGARSSSEVTIEYFNWHPFLMSLAFLVLMVPAVLSFEVFPFARHTNKSIHGFFNMLAFFTAIAAFAIILDCHNDLSTTGSFHTVHGCNGLLVLILLSINYFAGFILYGLQCGDSLRATLKPLHKRLGLCVIILALANIALGVFEQELKKSLKGSIHQLSNAIGVMCALTVVSIVFTVAKFADKKDDETTKYTPIVDTTNATTTYGTEMAIE